MRVLFELLRVLVILLFFGAILGGAMNVLYGMFGVNVANTNGGFLIGVAILILLFVLYRNKLQFIGFYKGDGRGKLPKKVSASLVTSSVLLMLIAPYVQ
ncbi:hypothetical protein GCM10008025_00520 [Ornithinibacillus halotolerans]|uniref:Uncharacterized protein n=1 Tax=Ornithinibacillus halotolerans TaxID=1274357 RepID=A0A916RK60_9BACI|nr:hypothetical protein GCM10008025_00520 [Ornithinibacillus halotolerans]